MSIYFIDLADGDGWARCSPKNYYRWMMAMDNAEAVLRLEGVRLVRIWLT